MPVSLTAQPASNSLNAAYRPILITASGMGNPVVYCDIYFNNVYYKTISKTQAPYEFDIQNAAKEFLKKFIAPNGGTAIAVAAPLITAAFVKVRGSVIDATTGFLVPDAPIPVQATGGTAATAGGGSQSNTFYILNSTLQHEDNQNMAAHLNAFKTGSWGANVYPLTHRIDGYKVGKRQSDYFPIVSDSVPSGITVHYMLRSGNSYLSSSGGNPPDNPPVDPPPPTCVPVAIVGTPNFPDAQVGVAYSYSFTVTGTAPITLSNKIKPEGMDFAISGSTITLSGTPIAEGSSISISVTANNACGTADAAGTIDIAPAEVVNGPHFGDTTFVSGDALNESEIANVVGEPNSTMTVEITTLDNTNGGSLNVNGSPAFINNTFDIVLDASGNGQLPVAILGTNNSPSVIRGIFTITAVSAGTIGTPNTYQISKIF